MKCKPNDVAVIVKCPFEEPVPLTLQAIRRAVVGRYVRVVRLVPHHICEQGTAPLIWEFEEPLRVDVGPAFAEIFGMADECLQPLPPQHDVSEHDRANDEPVRHEDYEDTFLCSER